MMFLVLGSNEGGKGSSKGEEQFEKRPKQFGIVREISLAFVKQRLKMKRKKWSEAEEKTLLTKYNELLNSGNLSKLNTREKKFKPIAEHVNSIHHFQDPLTYPFKWCWRDLSVKLQNMRHQYLCVKQKIHISNNLFNWDDALHHWDNFLLYKHVFGDINSRDEIFDDVGKKDEEVGMLRDDVVREGNGGVDDIDLLENVRDTRSGSGGEGGGGGKRLRMAGEQLLALRGMMVGREEKRREREWSREEKAIGNDHRLEEREFGMEIRFGKRDEELEGRDIECEDMQIMWAKKEYERRVRVEKAFDEERRRRMKLEEKFEEEEMQWREMMVGMQIEHEKLMMQLHMEACQNQIHVLGFITRMNYGLAGGLGTLTPHVMQNMHDANLTANGKPDTNSPSQFL